MRAFKALLVAVSTMATFVLLPATAAAEPVEDAVSTFTYTNNMHPLGFSARENTNSPFTANSDLAFWGKTAYHGNYDGFRIVDITEPDNPLEINDYRECAGNQGDVIVWDNILVRSWNSPAPAGATCDGEPVLPGVFPGGWEGVHVFDVSDPADPDLVASVETECGSHTATGVPDLENDRLLVYNTPSSGACPGIDIIEVPLEDPASASFLRFESSGDPTVGGGLPNLVTIAPPSSAQGTYGASSAAFGPITTAAGFAGPIELVNDATSTPPTGTPTDGCEAFDVTDGAIAVIDRGLCAFTLKVANAQVAGAGAVIVVNNVAGTPGTMTGTDPSITIPSVMVSLADGTTIKAGLPATGAVSENDLQTRPCHDTGVILGDAMRASCAGGNGFSVWSLDPTDGGSLEDPAILYSKPVQGVTIGHSAGFTWDGEVLVFGHEPGGGSQARCQVTSTEVDKTLFFFDTDTGASLGGFVNPRPQTATENCTWHNYNVVPTDSGYVLVSAQYQGGFSVVDFTDPANAKEIGFADPAPLSETQLILGGDWSTYWYDGRIYESDITRGLIIWEFSGPAVAGADKLGHLNPQTQEFTL